MDMHPLADSQLPHPPEITVEALRRLLADLPGAWKLSADDSHVFLLLDQDDEPQASINLAAGRLIPLHGRLRKDTG